MILLAEELGCGKVVAAVAGGETRADSVRIGVAEVGEDAAVSSSTTPRGRSCRTRSSSGCSPR